MECKSVHIQHLFILTFQLVVIYEFLIPEKPHLAVLWKYNQSQPQHGSLLIPDWLQMTEGESEGVKERQSACWEVDWTEMRVVMMYVWICMEISFSVLNQAKLTECRQITSFSVLFEVNDHFCFCVRQDILTVFPVAVVDF